MKHYSAQWYRSVLDAMHDMVLVKGADSHLLWANQAFLDYYGMSEAELFQIVDADHSDPDDTLQYVKDDLTVLDSGVALDIPQEAATDAAGGIRHFHTIKSPMFEDGTVVGTVGLSRLLHDTALPQRDIDHKDAKAFVAPLRALVESFPNPMLMVDIKQRVISRSPLWMTYFGDAAITPGSLFGETHPDLPDLQTQLKASLDRRAPVEGVARNVGTDGTSRMFSVRCSPWKYKDGSIGGATIIATDVTALSAQAAALETSNDELLQFSYRASHDLKGPLTTAKALAQFVALDIASGDLEDAAANAGKIEEMMKKLENTVISFLSLARADVGAAADVTVDLTQAIAEICIMLDHHIKATGVRIEADLRVRHIVAQDTRLRQILENLIANGIKYHDPQQDQPFVKICTSHTADGCIQLSVEDNGCGIPAGVGTRVFDLFSRFHTQSEGTGLGLAIVKKNVEALHGDITVEDTGHGTLFRITLPLIAMELAS